MTAFFIFVTFTTLLHALFLTSSTYEEELVPLTYTRRLYEVFLLEFVFFQVAEYNPV